MKMSEYKNKEFNDKYINIIFLIIINNKLIVNPNPTTGEVWIDLNNVINNVIPAKAGMWLFRWEIPAFAGMTVRIYGLMCRAWRREYILCVWAGRC